MPKRLTNLTGTNLQVNCPKERNGLGQREKEVREMRRLTGETTCKEWIGKGMINEGKRNLEARMSECEKYLCRTKMLGKDSYKTRKSLDG